VNDPNRRPDLETLIAAHQPMVSRICASYERDRDLARELIQEVWFAVWRALPSFRADSSVKTFVARIAQFRAISHVTQQAKRPLDAGYGDDRPAVPIPESEIISADERDRVLQAVRRLPIAYRQPVILTLEDFSPAEIASMLGLSQNVIGVRLNRARSMLREMLNAGTP
jgi:RNA polymerase sigma-70 factor (ECF subfamily)